MAAPPPPPPRGTMSLYAELLGGPKTEPAPAAAAAQKPSATKNPALRFQPIIRRPQQKPKTSRPKPLPVPSGTSTAAPAATSAISATSSATPSATPSATARPTLADWADADDGDGDDYDANGDRRHQRGGRKKKKKRFDEKQQRGAVVDWDEIYDPTRPTNLEAYLQSDERVAATRDWKAVLYAHRQQHQQQRARASHSDDSENHSDASEEATPFHSAFAPPPALLDAAAAAPAPAADPPAHPPLPGLVVSRPPVRFAAPQDVDMDDADTAGDSYAPPPASAPPDEPSARPGQAGFAARLMAKYGWTKGSGLGADGSGIVNPLRHKKMGGANSSRARIVGGNPRANSKSAQPDNGPDPSSSPPSTVIVLRNMVEGMPDLAAELADGQLVQEIGEECGAHYGRVQRVYIDEAARLVFIHFTDAVSALRAVNALNGRIFNGNAILPSFYDADKFEQGIYE